MSLPPPDAASTVVITGASSGIGAEMARELSRRGHHTTLVARRRELLDELAKDLEAGADVRTCDLADEASRAGLVDELLAGTRHVVGLCNNAGYGSSGRFVGLDQANERGQVMLNVVVVHHLTGAFLPGMVERGAGAVLNVGSIAGAQPLPGMATYAATKAFVNSFSEAVHAELAGTGVSVTALTPGPVKTEWAERAGMDASWDMADRLSGGMVTLEAKPVAKAAIAGMVNGDRVVVPGVAAKAAITSGRYIPRRVFLPAFKLFGPARRRDD